MKEIIPVESIVSKIIFLRGEKVLLDRDLAELYEVSTKALNQAVKRNERRFPADFMFRLTKKEKEELVTNCDRFQPLKHSSSLPRAFTEQGVAIALLRSQKRACHRHQHYYHEGIYSFKKDDLIPCQTGAKTRGD